MNSLPSSESRPSSGNGIVASISTIAAKLQRWALLRRTRVSLQPVATQASTSVWQNSPPPEPPWWAPGRPRRCRVGIVSVREGADRGRALEARAGLGARSSPDAKPCSGASIRSIVAVEMRSSFARTSGANALSPVRSKTSMISGRSGARRFPAGATHSAPMNPRASPTSSP